MPNDPKWRIISRLSGQEIPRVISVFVTMMTVAGNTEERGSLRSWRIDEIAEVLQIPAAAVEAIYVAMDGRVHQDGRLTGWERRQPRKEDPTGRDRVDRHRERRGGGVEAPEVAAPVTPCNARVESESEQRRDSDHTARAGNLRIPDAQELDALREVIFEAAGAALASPARCPAVNDVTAILGLMGPGLGPPCDLELDILPAIRARSAAVEPGRVHSLKYFAPAICERRDRRLAGAPAIDPNPPGAQSHGSRDHRPGRLEEHLPGIVAAAGRAVERYERRS